MCNPLFFQFLSSYGICVYLFVYAFLILSKSLLFCKFPSSETGIPTKSVGFYEKIFKKQLTYMHVGCIVSTDSGIRKAGAEQTQFIERK